MRLINVHSLELKEFYEPHVPPYVILSHRWQQEEISFQDFELDKGEQKSSYHKIDRLCQIARDEDVDWVWLDTCCIDKRNSTELSEAINSMYRWYQNSQFCVAYLYDVEDDAGALISSEWFTRCWTLQELIAPSDLRFHNKDWKHIGRKRDLCQQLSSATKIDEATLRGADPRRCSIAQRMSWAAGREATRTEDEAYSLLGLFDVSMPMLYGDGKRAFMTLQERIVQTSDDQSIFAWDIKRDQTSRDSSSLANKGLYGLLANSPSAFASCSNTVPTVGTPESREHAFTFTSVGIQLTLPTRPHTMRRYKVALDCTNGSHNNETRQVIYLQELQEDEEFARIDSEAHSVVTMQASDFHVENPVAFTQKMHVRQHIRHSPVDSVFHGFHIRNLKFPNCPSFEMTKTLVFCTGDGAVTRCSAGEDSGVAILASVPPNSYGTAAVIVPPLSASNRSLLPLRCLYLGFDSEFKPFCILGHRDSHDEVVKWIAKLDTERTRSDSEGAGNLQNLLITLNREIECVDLRAMNVLKDDSHVESDRYMFHIKSVQTRLFEFRSVSTANALRSSRSETVVKAHRTRESFLRLYDHGFEVRLKVEPSLRGREIVEPLLIWTVDILPLLTPKEFPAHIVALPLSLIALLVGMFSGTARQLIKTHIELFRWGCSFFEWIVFYFPIQICSSFGFEWVTVPMALGLFSGNLYGLYLWIWWILDPQSLTPDIITGLLNGTVSKWTPVRPGKVNLNATT